MRDAVVAMQSSRIREVANAALKNPDVLAFWFGESDEVTPTGVRDAAARSLERGETFYGHNLGLSELRDALAHYMSAFHPGRYTERIPVGLSSRDRHSESGPSRGRLAPLCTGAWRSRHRVAGNA